MTTAATARYSRPKRRKPNRRLWVCSNGDCDQTRITPLDTIKGPSCSRRGHGKMIKKGRLTR